MDCIDFRIDNTVASLEMEGLHITEDDKLLIRKCILGEISFDKAIELALGVKELSV